MSSASKFVNHFMMVWADSHFLNIKILVVSRNKQVE